MNTIHIDPVTPESIAAAKADMLAARREIERDHDMLTLERIIDTWGAPQVQRWLDGAIAIREDARRV